MPLGTPWLPQPRFNWKKLGVLRNGLGVPRAPLGQESNPESEKPRVSGKKPQIPLLLPTEGTVPLTNSTPTPHTNRAFPCRFPPTSLSGPTLTSAPAQAKEHPPAFLMLTQTFLTEGLPQLHTNQGGDGQRDREPTLSPRGGREVPGRSGNKQHLGPGPAGLTSC